MVNRFADLVSSLLLCFLLLTLCLVLVYKYVPIPFTPHMVCRKIEARKEGRELQIAHQWVDIEDISPALIKAVVEAEDAHFYAHGGFDIQAMYDAWEVNKQCGGVIVGGSTISQQTAKNIFCTQSRTYLRKVFEAYFTVLIEFVWGKERILEVYLNMIEMGDGVFGVEAAANRFFHCSASELNPNQSFAIASSLPNPRCRMPQYAKWY